MSDSPTDVYGPPGGPFTDGYGKTIYLACEKVSVCCGAEEHADVENFCGSCLDGTGFECSTHEKPWDGDEECRRN